MNEQEITAQIEQLTSLQSKFNPREAAEVVSQLQSEAFILKAKIAEAEAEFEKRRELTGALTKQIQNLYKLQIQNAKNESAKLALKRLELRMLKIERRVEPSLGELFATIGFKVDQKEISQAEEMLKALATHYSDTAKAIDKTVKANIPTKH